MLVSLPDRVSNAARGAPIDSCLEHGAYHGELALQVTRQVVSVMMATDKHPVSSGTDAHGQIGGIAGSSSVGGTARPSTSVSSVGGTTRPSTSVSSASVTSHDLDASVTFASTVLERLAMTGQHVVVAETLIRVAMESKRSVSASGNVHAQCPPNVSSCMKVVRLLTAFEGLPLESVIEAMVARAATAGGIERATVIDELAVGVSTCQSPSPAVRHAICK